MTTAVAVAAAAAVEIIKLLFAFLINYLYVNYHLTHAKV